MAAQECIPTNEDKDKFGADYRVLNRVWNSLSPDPFLAPYKYDYQWLTRIYESVKPTTEIGGLVWAALGAKTMELVHENLIVGAVHEDEDILDAIRYHTTGNVDMTLLQKITYLADYIEPWRNKATNLPAIREAAFQDLDKALYMVLHDTLQYLETIHAEVDSTTQQAYEFYRQLQEEKQD